MRIFIVKTRSCSTCNWHFGQSNLFSKHHKSFGSKSVTEDLQIDGEQENIVPSFLHFSVIKTTTDDD